MKKLYASALLAAAMAMPTFYASAAVEEGNMMVQLHAREKSSAREQYRVEVEESVLLGEAAQDKTGWVSDEGSFTIGGWFKLDEAGLKDGSWKGAHLIQHHARAHANANGSFYIGVNENGIVTFAAAYGQGNNYGYSGVVGLNLKDGEEASETLTRGQAKVEFGKWTNIAFSVSAADSIMSFYQDGKLITQSRYTGTFSWLPDNPCVFGFGANGFEGQIDQVYFLREALTPATALKAMRNPATALSDEANVCAVYDFSNMGEDNTFAPVAGTSTALASVVKLTGSGGGDGITDGTAAVVEPELVASTRDMNQGYQAYNGPTNHSRVYPTVRISTSGGFTDMVGRKQGENVYQDRTDVVVNVAPGEKLKVSFPESNTEWMHPYVYIDRANDGAFSDDWDSEANAPAEGSDLVGYYYSPDEDTYYISDGTTSGDAHLLFKTYELPFDLPAELQSGDVVRARIKTDWNNIESYGQVNPKNHIANNGGLILDFMIKVGLPDTIRVAADPVEGGEVYIDVEGVTEAYASRGAKAHLVAKAAEDYEFVNWTCGEEVVTTDAIVDVLVEGNANYVAHFNKLPERFTVTYSGENVTVKVTKDGLALNSGSRVFVDEVITIELETEGAFKASGLTVNGVDRFADYLENNKLDITVTEDINITAVAEEVVAHLNLTYLEGGDGGTVSFWYFSDEEESEESRVYVGNGEVVPVGGMLYALFAPNDGFVLSLDINGRSKEDLMADGTLEENEGAYQLYYYMEAEDVNVTVGFVDAAINMVGADANGAARYFNLQGMEVKAENLTNGIYVVRNGEKAEKVYIRK